MEAVRRANLHNRRAAAETAGRPLWGAGATGPDGRPPHPSGGRPPEQMETDVTDLERLSDPDLNDALARVARQYPDRWDHPRRVAVRAEMARRAVAAGRKSGR